MGDSENDTINTLKNKINLLETQNQIYLQTINALSKELISRKRTMEPNDAVHNAVACKLRKIEPDASIFQETAPRLQNAKQLDMEQLPIEILLLLFKYVRRDDLDRYRRVCHRWNALISENSKNLPHRNILLLKLIDKNHISLEAKSSYQKKKYSFSLEEYDRNVEFFSKLRKLLKYSIVKRWIICNISFTDEFARRLREVFLIQPVKINRLEILAANLMRISPDVFHKFLGQMLIANQYFIDGIRGASEDHFSCALFDQKGIKEADDFTVYDVRSVDNEEISLELGNDVLLEFIFGTKEMPERNSLYLDSPEVTSGFLEEILKRFVDADSLDRMLNHVEFAHCRLQIVPTHRDFILEYDHPIQVEWSAINKRTGRILEARISRNGDDDNFCHLTLNLPSNNA